MALKDLKKPRKILRLYHGSPVKNIKHFDILYSRESFLDFGKGIYFTTSEEQAMQWSIKQSNTGAVYMVEVDSDLLVLKQYLDYSDEFIDTFCLCRAGFETTVNQIKGFNSVYGYVIDNDKAGIIKTTNDYALGKATPAMVRARIHVFDNKDQICFKNQEILNKLKIKNVRYTEYVSGFSRNDRRAVKWVKKI